MLKIVIKPLVLTGPTGSGRTVLAFKLVTDFPHKFEKVVRYTSRPKRKSEVDGFHYHFLSREDMEAKHQKQEFLIFKKDPNHGDYYGTTEQQMDRISKIGKIPVLEMNAQLFSETMNSVSCNGIYLRPPSYELLRQRMAESIILTDEEINQKINKGKEEEEFVLKNKIFPPQSILLNKEISETYQKLKARLFQLY